MSNKAIPGCNEPMLVTIQFTTVVKLKAVVDDPPEPPSIATSGSAGADIRSAVDVVLWPGRYLAISTGYSLEIQEGFEMQIRPRSGLAVKNGVTVMNSPGTIDSDFRGELKVILINHSEDPFTIKKGDRIAQAVVAPVTKVSYQVVTEELTETSRGHGGFGSSGVQ